MRTGSRSIRALGLAGSGGLSLLASSLLSLLVSGLVGCGGASEGGGDAGLDAGSDASLDAFVPLVCEWPSPAYGAGEPTRALREAAARCGQAPHGWLEAPELGSPTELDAPRRMSAAVLEALAAGAGLELPFSARYDVQLRAYRYWTQDRGLLVEASAGLALPLEWSGAEPPPTILLLHGTMGFADGCSASTDGGMQTLAAALATQGFAVVYPDYLGLKASGDPTGFPHPYLIGQPTAIASLDALRAAGRMQAADRAGLCLSPRFASFGMSQGGHAALWVERLQPHYAAELALAGTVAAIGPSDLTRQIGHALDTGVGPTATTEIAMALFALGPVWYGDEARISEILLPPWDVQALEELSTGCGPSTPSAEIFAMGLEGVFLPAVLDAASAGTLGSLDPYGCLLSENSLQHTSVPRIASTDPAFGTLFVLAENDEILHTPSARLDFEDLCAQGMPMHFLECQGASHVDGVTWAMPEILGFLRARLEGVAPDPATLCVPQAPTRCSLTPAP